MALRLEEAQFVGLFVESVFYGLYLSTLIRCLQVLLWIPNVGWKPLPNISIRILSVTLLLFALSTFNLALAVVRNIQGLFAQTEGGAVFVQVGQVWINVAKPFFFQAQTSVADLVLIYRCWIICERSLRLTAIPIFLWISSVSLNMTYLILRILSTRLPRPSDRLKANSIITKDVLPAFWATVIALNVYATSTIVYRLWNVVHTRKQAEVQATNIVNANRPKMKLHYLMRIIIDSALIYTIFTIILFASIFSGTAVYITSAAESQIIGICFNLILIRISRENVATTDHPSNSRPFTSLHFKTSPIETQTLHVDNQSMHFNNLNSVIVTESSEESTTGTDSVNFTSA